MNTTHLRLVTIGCDAELEERLTEALHRLGASGGIACDARGDPAHGVRMSPRPGENVRLESLVTDVVAVAEQVLEHLAQEYFPREAIVAWTTDTAVVRGEPYEGEAVAGGAGANPSARPHPCHRECRERTATDRYSMSTNLRVKVRSPAWTRARYRPARAGAPLGPRPDHDRFQRPAARTSVEAR